ncbi:MAG TPA: M20/M25/M40 family metallo-hydrolase [Vicinamibacteria bacterium]|nr:M20/M25/M40 family metallo-hydrolase [Vicinamibacteria bacterium]
MRYVSAKAIVGLLALLATGTTAQESGREVWITIGRDEAARLQGALAGAGRQDVLQVETEGDLVLARVREDQVPLVSRAVHRVLRRCGGFVAHESREAALATMAREQALAPDEALLAYTVDNGTVVQALIGSVLESSLRSTIESLAAFFTRYHTTQTGLDSAHWIRDRWTALVQGRADAAVELYSHPSSTTPQPSVVLTIQGTALPGEVVVLGAHQDSINGGASGRAPGADDDASGVATLTEVIRVAIANGYRPQRTVKFMAYAAEEVGLRGSADIAAQYKNGGVNVVGVLQLDMTNYKGTATTDIVMITDRTNAAQNAFVEQLVDTYLGLPRSTTQCGYGCSDHSSWHSQGFVASFPFEALFADTNPTIHTANDTLAQSGNNANHAVKFAKLAAAYVAELAKGGIGDGDTAPPTTSITAPPAGSTVSGTVAVSASASDNVGVTNLEFYVDGVLAGSDSTSPYGFSWNTLSAANGSHLLRSRAYDAAGNAGTSADVGVTVSNGGGPADLTGTYDSTLKAPKCATVGRSCDSGSSLLLGRGSKGPEPSHPNTINNSCADGTSGTFHSDESNDRLKVSTVDGTALAPGKQVRVDATVWAYSSYTSDKLDLYYAANALSPNWTLIATLTPPGSGARTLSATYTLPAGALQAIRAQFRYQGSAGTCSSGGYNDRDDLVFAVDGPATPDFSVACSPASLSATQGGSATSTCTVTSISGFSSAVGLACSGLPSGASCTFSPASVTPPANASVSSALTVSVAGTAAGSYSLSVNATSGSTTRTASLSLSVTASGPGDVTATYDSTLRAPKCATVGRSCDSGSSLLLGRGSKGPEPSYPNTINSSCADGTSGTFHSDESNDRLRVSTVDGTALAPGKQVRVDATVWAYSSYTSDQLDLYHAANANSPNWTFIATLTPPGSGARTLSATYTLPAGALQAIRAQFRYQGSAGTCSSGNYNDRDDLIFTVSP